MHKSALLFPILIGLISAPSLPQSVAEHGGALAIAPSFVSGYMSSGVWLGGLSFQPTVQYSRGSLSFEALANFPIQDKIPGTSDPEIDLSASHTWDIVPNLFTIRLGSCLYAYPRANKDNGFFRATWEPRLTFDCTHSETAFSLSLYYDVTMNGGGWEFGFNRLIPI